MVVPALSLDSSQYVLRNVRRNPCSKCGEVHEFLTYNCLPLVGNRDRLGFTLLAIHDPLHPEEP